MRRSNFPVGLILALIAGPVLAHPGHGSDGFGAGLLHPLLGWDHLLAMLAVGLYAARTSAAPWRMPATFVAAMLAGTGLGAMGIDWPGVETGVASSVLVLGLMIAATMRLPGALPLVAFFALCHGVAHGVEMPADAARMAGSYVLGLVLVTALLHAVGYVVGRQLAGQGGRTLERGVGGVLAIAGVVMLST
ncbi:MAG: HupE/UreJ family protein [Zoogloeaceae bacterium]|nr:HupE/UreJ family protein [Zoogloeaceae bacterium]